eukprot:6475955-Amphidinium_carterae.1
MTPRAAMHKRCAPVQLAHSLTEGWPAHCASASARPLSVQCPWASRSATPSQSARGDAWL